MINKNETFNSLHPMAKSFLKFYSWLRWCKENIKDDTHREYISFWFTCKDLMRETGLKETDIPVFVKNKNYMSLWFECDREINLDSMRYRVFDWSLVTVRARRYSLS